VSAFAVQFQPNISNAEIAQGQKAQSPAIAGLCLSAVRQTLLFSTN